MNSEDLWATNNGALETDHNLKKYLGVNLKVQQAQYWMHRWADRMKRASYFYVQARSEDARRFRRLLEKLRNLKPGETIVFQDETVFSLHPRLGRGWAERGKPSKVPSTSQNRKRLNLSG